MQDVFDFSWTVPKDGYELRPGKKGKVLAIKGGEFLASRYWPLRDEPALFRNFCAMEPTPENVLAFANRYGWLGLRVLPFDAGLGIFVRKSEPDVPAHHLKRETVQQPTETTEQTEKISEWMHSSAQLREAIDIWTLIEARDVTNLLRRFHWRDDTNRHEWLFLWPSPDNPLLSLPVGPVPGVAFSRGNVLAPAAITVQRLINSELTLNATPRIVYDPDTGNQVLKIVPNNLYGAMWLQLADAVTGHKEFRACKDIDCGHWFVVAPGRRGGTKRKVYCSTTCKVRDFRRSQEESNKRKGKRNVKKTTRPRRG